MLDNKWTHGKVKFSLDELPSIFFSSPGIKAISTTIDNNIGEEITLLITESKYNVREFEGKDITKFMQKAGLVNTSHGPVCFFLYYFPDPLTGAQVTYENTLNPKDDQQLYLYKKLSKQKYWHVIIADDERNVVNFFEFQNVYNLADTLIQIESVCGNMQVSDFMSAKAEYENNYSIERLLAM